MSLLRPIVIKQQKPTNQLISCILCVHSVLASIDYYNLKQIIRGHHKVCDYGRGMQSVECSVGEGNAKLIWFGLVSPLGMEVVKNVTMAEVCNLLSALQRGLRSITLVWASCSLGILMEVVKYVITAEVYNLLSALQRGLHSVTLVWAS